MNEWPRIWMERSIIWGFVVWAFIHLARKFRVFIYDIRKLPVCFCLAWYIEARIISPFLQSFFYWNFWKIIVVNTRWGDQPKALLLYESDVGFKVYHKTSFWVASNIQFYIFIQLKELSSRQKVHWVHGWVFFIHDLTRQYWRLPLTSI